MPTGQQTQYSCQSSQQPFRVVVIISRFTGKEIKPQRSEGTRPASELGKWQAWIWPPFWQAPKPVPTTSCWFCVMEGHFLQTHTKACGEKGGERGSAEAMWIMVFLSGPSHTAPLPKWSLPWLGRRVAWVNTVGNVCVLDVGPGKRGLSWADHKWPLQPSCNSMGVSRSWGVGACWILWNPGFQLHYVTLCRLGLPGAASPRAPPFDPACVRVIEHGEPPTREFAGFLQDQDSVGRRFTHYPSRLAAGGSLSKGIRGIASAVPSPRSCHVNST